MAQPLMIGVTICHAEARSNCVGERFMVLKQANGFYQAFFGSCCGRSFMPQDAKRANINLNRKNHVTLKNEN